MRLPIDISGKVSAFRRNERGTIALIFALAFLPILCVIGVTVDYSRSNATKSALQSALDATATAMARSATNLTADQLQAQASAYLAAAFNRTDAPAPSLTATYSNPKGNNGTVVLKASVNMDTSFLKAMGTNSLPISATTTVELGGGARLRVALVLDVTGSMGQDGKLTAMKTAAKNMLDKIKATTSVPEDAYVSIVSFNVDVNVGASNYNADWIDWTDWDYNNGRCSNSSRASSRGSCSGTWTPDNHNTWNGCVMDRGNSSGPSSWNYDANVTAPSLGDSASKFPADQYDTCSSAAMPLNNDWTAMKNMITNLDDGGNTNQGIGLAHGWASLSGIGPYQNPPAKDPDYQYKSVIILLSDGLNTANRWYNNASSIDARQRITCDNIKLTDITLYTVQVNTDRDPTSSILKYCASDPSKFLMLTSASQIITAFDQIGSELSQMRISK